MELQELNSLESYKIRGIEIEKYKQLQQSDIDLQKLIPRSNKWQEI